MDPPAPTTGHERLRGGLPVSVLLGLAGLVWGFATPYLWFGAMITAAPFFGEQPSPAELRDARRLLVGAVACGVLVPAVGLLVALATRRRVASALLAVALGLGVAAGVATGPLTGDGLRELFGTERRADPAPDPGPRPCQEHSGGGNRCPGG